jgi:hypothetical protein
MRTEHSVPQDPHLDEVFLDALPNVFDEQEW